MQQIGAIIRRELKAYFDAPLAYIFLTVYLLITSWLFMRGFFLINQVSMRNYFTLLPWIFLFLIPAITMRLWAEEKKSGTLELMLTSPITNWQMVLGKFLASFIFLLIALILSLNIPIILAFIGNPDIGVIFTGYIGVIFMGAAYLSIGLWASSVSKNQIVAFIIGVATTFVLLIMGKSFVLYSQSAVIVPILRYLSLGTHFESIMRGVIDTRDVIYYLLVIVFFLYLNARNLINRV